ncbi:hypothetical protein HMI55_000850 [Coelomomyces lativittatus]|nr:hypothetical protein HMI56_006214 [Coelomomyces lativittatus]KAJ1517013.1 hypothetical protein HMI55_000850 [Coelomomyces lativittatus]
MNLSNRDGKLSQSQQSLEEGYSPSSAKLDLPAKDSIFSTTEPADRLSVDKENSLPTPNPKKSRRICCYVCTCLLVFLVLLISAALIFFFVFLKYPTFAFDSIVPSTTLPPVEDTPIGFNVNLNVAANITNPNSFSIDVYSIDLTAYIESNSGTSSSPDFVGHYDSISFSKKSTTPILFPISYIFRKDGSSEKAVVKALALACAPLSQANRSPLKLRYNVKVGLSILKWTNYKFSYSDSTSYPCPIDLSILASLA